MQISFCVACSMLSYPLGRKRKGRKLRNCLICNLLRNLDFASLYTVSQPQRTENCAGENSGMGTQSCFIWAFFPEHDGSIIQSYQNTKADWDLTVSTQNKWMWQKRIPCTCEQKKSSVLVRNGITRNVFLPWEESPGCRGKLRKRSYSLLVLSSWQVENGILSKSHSCTQQKQFWPLWLDKKSL